MEPSVSITVAGNQVREEEIAEWDADPHTMVILLRRDGWARAQDGYDLGARGGWELRLGATPVLGGVLVTGIEAAAPRAPTLRSFTWKDGRVGFVLGPRYDAEGRATFARAVERLRAHFGGRGLVSRCWSEDEVQIWLGRCYRAVVVEPRGWPAGVQPPAAVELVLEGTRRGGYRATVCIETVDPPRERAWVAEAPRLSLDAAREALVLPMTPPGAGWAAARAGRSLRWAVRVSPELTGDEMDGLGPLRLCQAPFGFSVPHRSDLFDWLPG